MLRKLLGFLLLLLPAFSAGCASWFKMPDPARFRGGEIGQVDGSYIFARLPQFSLKHPAQYSQQFSRFPFGPVMIHLELADAVDADTLSARLPATRITMEVTTEKGHRMCLASGRIVTQKEKHSWVIEKGDWGVSSAQLVNSGCRRVGLDYDRLYILKLTVEELDPQMPDVTVRPVISAHVPDAP